jgi:hypothetical protein
VVVVEEETVMKRAQLIQVVVVGATILGMVLALLVAPAS